MLDLNTITKEQFAETLMMEDDLNDFYLPREKQILNMSFDFESMKKEFEGWLIENCENQL